jgi:hypothetical protein
MAERGESHAKPSRVESNEAMRAVDVNRPLVQVSL